MNLIFETSGPEIKHLTAHNFVWKGVFFLPLLSRNFDDQLSLNFNRFVILCILCWDTLSEKTGLWQLPKVSSVFKLIKQIFKIVATRFDTDHFNQKFSIICIIVYISDMWYYVRINGCYLFTLGIKNINYFYPYKFIKRCIHWTQLVIIKDQ